MPSLLVVDDEPAIQHAFRRAFGGGDFAIRSAGSAAEAVLAVEREVPDVVVLDVHLPDATGLETYHRVRRIDARIPVVLITGHGTTDLAIEAMKEGAFDYLLKPLELSVLRELIGRAVRSSRRMRVPATLPDVEPAAVAGGDLLVGRCPAMQEVYKAIGRVARQDVTVLILESGTEGTRCPRFINTPEGANRCGDRCAPSGEPVERAIGHEKGVPGERSGSAAPSRRTGTVFLDIAGSRAGPGGIRLVRSSGSSGSAARRRSRPTSG